MKTTLRLLLAGFLAVFCAAPARAQSFQGGLRGAVRDADGVIPGADVTLTNDDTNLVRHSTTNAAGEYAFPSVLPGTYSLTASAPGFRTFESSGIRIGTQTFLTLDITLEIGSVTQTVVVTGQAPLIDKTNASVASMLDRTTLEALPTAGRNAFFLAVTTPNVVPVGDPQLVRQQDQDNSSRLALGGGPVRANNYLLDGVPITDLLNRAAIIPSIEAVEEVRVQVGTYDAEIGRTAGGVFNATHKSGANRWHGSALVQNRPEWGQGNLFFAKRAGLAKPDSYFYLYGGSVGGPIVKDRTFFWTSTEGYRTKTARNAVLTLPTARERTGDFSQTFDTQGRLVVIFDPLTTRPDPASPGQFVRSPFPDNIIPAERIDPVARNLLTYLPLPDSGKSATATADIVDVSNQATVKIEHRLAPRYTATGLYAWYHSTEPGARFYGGLPSDPAGGLLGRTVHLVAINNIFVPSDSTVLALRYGLTRFLDNEVPTVFDPATLGFSRTFVDAIPYKKFPAIAIVGYNGFGDGSRRDRTFQSQTANVTLSKSLGRHTMKIGGDYRQMTLDFFSPGQGSGNFGFTRAFTQGPNPNVSRPDAGDSVAGLLLGYPAGANIPVAAPGEFFIRYYGAYVQDEFRLRPNLTVNVGLRYELEDGLRERENRFTVGFDRERPFPVQVPGLQLKGGLMYAGVDGYATHQSDPSHLKFGPRGGVAWSVNEKTVLRGGYGLFWAPMQFAPPAENTLGTRGFTATTTFVTSFDGGLRPCAACSLMNPFPNGIEQPRGSRDGLLTGAGGDVNFIDQFGKSPHVHQFSVDVQRELRAEIAATVSYLGSRSDNLNIGGINAVPVNINQLDPIYQSLGSALQQPVTNPFFGNPAFGAFSTSPTIARGQLLRPYPQFLNVLAHRVSAGRARYDSFALKVERRLRNGWGLRANYTYSVAKDNQFGESNFFANSVPVPVNHYDLDGEYGHSLSDTPHRLNLTGTFELPFGEGRRWLNDRSVLGRLLGGWAITALGAYQSGFPAQLFQEPNSGLFGSGQRPNVVPGIDPRTPGNPSDRVNAWFNRNAWTASPPFTFGDAPRTDPRVRGPSKKNWDLAIQKAHRIGGGTLSVRAEIINVFDEPNLLGPNSIFGSVDFGRITSVGGFPRMLQLMARFAW
jgi:hypothetical protein